MVFSSNIFLFGFVPIFFTIYVLISWRFRNGFLLASSLLFYGYGTGPVLLVLIFSVLLNYVASHLFSRARGRLGLAIFAGAVILNLSALAYYKYTGFLWDAANDLFHGGLAAHHWLRPQILLPIGISFFTFQALSYLTDVYTGRCAPAKSFVAFGMYHTLFPQLIAGPIVRYIEVEEQIYQRSVTLDDATAGAMRFIIGLAKKVVLADNTGIIADHVFALTGADLTAPVTWAGAVAYSLQILFDFSGYSDMAIGLARVLGFNFPENFNSPYLSQSVTEFWRRWHMTLSRWFRDYVYIPLGGNRRGGFRTYINLFVVFFLCGLWHGAAYTFIIWGLYHGLLLVIERVLMECRGFTPHGFAGRIWTMVMVVVGWVIFRAPDMHYALHFVAAMFGFGQPGQPMWSVINFLPPDRAVYMVIALVMALLPLQAVLLKLKAMPAGEVTARACALLLFAYSALQLSGNTFNPFIYFRF